MFDCVWIRRRSQPLHPRSPRHCGAASGRVNQADLRAVFHEMVCLQRVRFLPPVISPQRHPTESDAKLAVVGAAKVPRRILRDTERHHRVSPSKRGFRGVRDVCKRQFTVCLAPGWINRESLKKHRLLHFGIVCESSKLEKRLVSLVLADAFKPDKLNGLRDGFVVAVERDQRLENVEPLRNGPLVLGNAFEDSQVPFVTARASLVACVDNLRAVEFDLLGFRIELQALVNWVRPSRFPFPPKSFPPVNHAVFRDDIAHQHAVDVASFQVVNKSADLCHGFRRDDVVRIRPHEPVAGCHVASRIASGGEVVNVRPLVFRVVPIFAGNASSTFGD